MSESRLWAKTFHTPSIMSRIKAIFCGRRSTETSEPEPVQSAPAQQVQATPETPWWYHDLDLDIPAPTRPYENNNGSIASSPATLDPNNCSSPATSMRSTTPPGTPPSLDAILSPIVADVDFGIPLIREEPCIPPPAYPMHGCKPAEVLGLTIDSPLGHSTSDDTPQAPLTPAALAKASNLPTPSETRVAPEPTTPVSPVVSPPVPAPLSDNAHPTTYDLFQQLSAKLHAEMRAMVVLQQHIEAKREIERLRKQVAILKEQKERNILEIKENTRILAEKKALLGTERALEDDD
ncbi:hypothetical protein FRC01_014824 [Tulasnella sp. 417]|nr:hypothetical protein FRC01_014824 [Tulasnella sp. 417]